MDFNQQINLLRTTFKKNRAEIYTGIGIGGFFVTIFAAIKGTAKAVRKIDQRKAELEVDDISLKEKFLLCWRDYIFPFATGMTSAALIIKSDSIKAKETGELLSAVVVSRSLLNDYKEAVEETLDEKKKEKVKEAAKEKEINRILSDPSTPVHSTGYGDVLFIENLTGTVFRSSKDAVKDALIAAERQIKGTPGYISLNDLRYELGLPGCAVGEMLGFNESTNNGHLDYTLTGHDYQGELCWSLTILVEPMVDYDFVYPR